MNIFPYPALISRDAALVTNITFALFTLYASFNFVIELIISAIYPVVSPSPAQSRKVPNYEVKILGNRVVDPSPFPMCAIESAFTLVVPSSSAIMKLASPNFI